MVTYINKNTHAIYAGNAGEAPMDVQNGSVFHEMDTGLYYMYDAENREWLVQEDNAGGGEGGTTDHTQLTNRDKPDQHPIEAISGLKEKVDNPLGLTATAPGDLIKVKAVDASGAPTAWEKTSLEELEGKWELIEEFTHTGPAAGWSRSQEPDGTPYRFKAVQLLCTIGDKDSNAFGNTIFSTARDSVIFRLEQAGDAKESWRCLCYPNYGFYDVQGMFISVGAGVNMGTIGMTKAESALKASSAVPIVAIGSSGNWLSNGSTMQIWAVRW